VIVDKLSTGFAWSVSQCAGLVVGDFGDREHSGHRFDRRPPRRACLFGPGRGVARLAIAATDTARRSRKSSRCAFRGSTLASTRWAAVWETRSLIARAERTRQVLGWRHSAMFSTRSFVRRWTGSDGSITGRCERLDRPMPASIARGPSKWRSGGRFRFSSASVAARSTHSPFAPSNGPGIRLRIP
jgi:hypothetical protein